MPSELRKSALDFEGRASVNALLNFFDAEEIAWHAVCLEREIARLRAALEWCEAVGTDLRDGNIETHDAAGESIRARARRALDGKEADGE